MEKTLVTLKKSQSIFEEYRINMLTDKDRTAAVKAFESCYELAWKSMKRFLESEGVSTESPKDTFRKAAIANLIVDPKLWFNFQETRNLTTHTYSHDVLIKISENFDKFSVELAKLIRILEEKIQ